MSIKIRVIIILGKIDRAKLKYYTGTTQVSSDIAQVKAALDQEFS